MNYEWWMSRSLSVLPPHLDTFASRSSIQFSAHTDILNQAQCRVRKTTRRPAWGSMTGGRMYRSARFSFFYHNVVLRCRTSLFFLLRSITPPFPLWNNINECSVVCQWTANNWYLVIHQCVYFTGLQYSNTPSSTSTSTLTLAFSTILSSSFLGLFRMMNYEWWMSRSLIRQLTDEVPVFPTILSSSFLGLLHSTF
jgi:hypothetical protein